MDIWVVINSFGSILKAYKSPDKALLFAIIRNTIGLKNVDENIKISAVQQLIEEYEKNKDDFGCDYNEEVRIYVEKITVED